MDTIIVKGTKMMVILPSARLMESTSDFDATIMVDNEHDLGSAT